MNFLDIIIVIVLILLTLGALILQFMAVSDKEYGIYYLKKVKEED